MFQLEKWSIKYKLIGLLVGLSTTLVLAYAWTTAKAFSKDKTAYIYEANLNISKSIARQAALELKNYRNMMILLLSYYDPRTDEFSNEGKSLFYAQNQIHWLQIQTLAGPKAQLKKNISPENLELMDQAVPSFLNQLNSNETALTILDRNSKTFLYGIHLGPAEKNSSIVYIFGNHLNFIDELEEGRDKVSFIYSMDEQKNLLQTKNLPPDTLIHLKKFNITQSNPNGTFLVSGKDEFLASYSKVPFTKLLIVVMLAKSNAFRALQILNTKAILIAIAFICISILISIFSSRKITKALANLHSAAENFALGDFQNTIAVTSQDEVGQLTKTFNHMATEIRNLLFATADKARMESELKTAKVVQETLFPELFCKFENMEIAGYYQPASECGGDWWHYNKVGDKIAMCIADATGHGAPAALITSAAKSAITIIEKLKNMSPSQFLNLLNLSISEVSKGKVCMTAIMASFDEASGELIYSNASHESPILLPLHVGSIKKADLQFLMENRNPRLGENKLQNFKESKVHLNPGDLVFFYTDGVTDLQSPEGKQFGERKLFNFLIANQKLSPKEFVDSLVRELKAHQGGALLLDDVTFFACKYSPQNLGS